MILSTHLTAETVVDFRIVGTALVTSRHVRTSSLGDSFDHVMFHAVNVSWIAGSNSNGIATLLVEVVS